MPVPVLYARKFASVFIQKFLEEEKSKENKETNPATETNWGNDPVVAAIIAIICLAPIHSHSSNHESFIPCLAIVAGQVFYFRRVTGYNYWYR